jgi:hypothetical protein
LDRIIFLFCLDAKKKQKNQSAAADKMKLVPTFEYSWALVRLTSQVKDPTVVT